MWHATFLCRECFVNVDDAQSIRSFVHSASKGHPQLQYAKISDELWSLHLLNLTKTYMSSNDCIIKTLVTCVGRQSGSNVWVLNQTLQLTENGNLIIKEDQMFYWLAFTYHVCS